MNIKNYLTLPDTDMHTTRYVARNIVIYSAISPNNPPRLTFTSSQSMLPYTNDWVDITVDFNELPRMNFHPKVFLDNLDTSRLTKISWDFLESMWSNYPDAFWDLSAIKAVLIPRFYFATKYSYDKQYLKQYTNIDETLIPNLVPLR